MKNLASLINTAHQANQQQDYKRARQLCKQALKINKAIPESWYNLGIAERGLGQRLRAIRAQREALRLTRNSANAQNNIGLELLYLKEHKDAETAFRRVIKLEPEYPFAYSNLGKLLGESDKQEEALEFLSKAHSIEPDNPQILCNLGAGLNDLNQYEEAEVILQKAISIDPQSAEAFSNLGVTLLGLQRYEDAGAILQKAIALDPQSSNAHLNLGITLLELKLFKEAAAILQKTISLDSQSPVAHTNLGHALVNLNRYVEAEAILQKAIALDSSFAAAYKYLGLVLTELNRYAEAEVILDKAITLDPLSAPAHSNLGLVLSGLNRDDEAERLLRKAIMIDNDFAQGHHNLGHFLLGMQRFSEGWSEYEYRGRTRNQSNLTVIPGVPVWNGNFDNLNTLLIHAEQGIGDQVLFSSFLQRLSDDINGANIHITADKRLLPIYERSFKDLHFFDKDDQLSSKNADAQISLASLGQFFIKDESAFLKTRHPYLLHDNERTRLLREQITVENKILCGISWFSKRKNDNVGDHKSLSLAELKPLLALPNIQFVNLQYGDVTDEIAMFEKNTGIKILQVQEIDNFNDIDSLLSLIAACDLVLTVSNITTHLAGSIGKKTFQLSPKGQGKFWYWRNLTDDRHSLWYPSVKIFEQKHPGDWHAPINDMVSEMKNLGHEHEAF